MSGHYTNTKVVTENQEYGKANVRVVRVYKQPDGTHILKQLTVRCLLDGDFDVAYTKGDNKPVVPTDTVKNTVYVLAKQHKVYPIENFAITICKHFLGMYNHVSKVNCYIVEDTWERINVNGKPHAHSFERGREEKHVCNVIATRKGTEVISGSEGAYLLKTTASGFSDFHRDKYTTLKDVDDRIFATQVTAHWKYNTLDVPCYDKVYAEAMKYVKEIFATEYSKSVQQTMYQMGQKILHHTPCVESVSFALPNKHCWLVDLKPFGLDNPNEVFVATDAPNGQIQVTVKRARSKL